MIFAVRLFNDGDGFLQPLFRLGRLARRLMNECQIAQHRGIERVPRAQSFRGHIGCVLQSCASRCQAATIPLRPR